MSATFSCKRADGSRFKVRLMALEIAGTYAGVMEGTRERASRAIREKLARQLPTDELNNGISLATPTDPTLPPWRCTASFDSFEAVDLASEASRLTHCWFVESLDRSVSEMVQDCLEDVDWQRRAKPVDLF